MAACSRSTNRGQKAMALAMIYPEPGKRGVKTLNTSRSDQVMLSNARAVLRHSRALAEDVLADRTKFDAALDQVNRHREASLSTDAQMAELRAGARHRGTG